MDAFSLLGTQMTILALMLLATATINPNTPWMEDASRSIRVSDATWQRAESLTGPGGTTDDRICRLIAMAEHPDPEAPRLNPAGDLERRLRCFDWFHSARRDRTGLTLFVTKPSPRAERAIPPRYGGMPVTVHRIQP